MGAFMIIPAYEVMHYKDGWWVVEEFEDCGLYTYEKINGPFTDKEEAEYAAKRK